MDKTELNNLDKKVKTLSQEKQDKYFNQFSKQASYRGNGTYEIGGLFSSDTRELFLMFVGQQEFKMKFD